MMIVANCGSCRKFNLSTLIRGVARIARGGARIIFFRFGNLHVAKQHAAHGEAMWFVRGVRGHVPRENLFKWCNLVRFGVYLDQILCLKNFKNYHFLYKNFKNYHFYIFFVKSTIFSY